MYIIHPKNKNMYIISAINFSINRYNSTFFFKYTPISMKIQIHTLMLYITHNLGQSVCIKCQSTENNIQKKATYNVNIVSKGSLILCWLTSTISISGCVYLINPQLGSIIS